MQVCRRLLEVAIPALALLLLPAGCASVLGNPRQDVLIKTDPPGAALTLDGYRMGDTPTTIVIERGKTHMVELEKDGYRRRAVVLEGSVQGGWVLLDVLTGLLPLAVDAATDKWESFDSQVFATLELQGTGASAAADNSEAGQPRVDIGRCVLPRGQLVTVIGESVRATYTGTIARDEFRSRGGTIALDGDLRAAKYATGPYDLSLFRIDPGSDFYIRLGPSNVYRFHVSEAGVKQAVIEWKRL